MFTGSSSAREAATARIILITLASLSFFSSVLDSSEVSPRTMTDLADSTEATCRLGSEEVEPLRVTTRVFCVSGSTNAR